MRRSEMASIQVRIKNGPSINVILDRVPNKDDYIGTARALLRVEAAVLIDGDASFDAILFAVKDPDGKPDEIVNSILPSHFSERSTP
jgi:hypothetical protein